MKRNLPAAVPAKLAASVASVGVSFSPKAARIAAISWREVLNNNVLGNADKFLVVAVAELRFGHVDSALMMRRHHRWEVMVDITRGLHGHVIHHFSERIAIEFQAELESHDL